jgi:hypothetical protein
LKDQSVMEDFHLFCQIFSYLLDLLINSTYFLFELLLLLTFLLIVLVSIHTFFTNLVIAWRTFHHVWTMKRICFKLIRRVIFFHEFLMGFCIVLWSTAFTNTRITVWIMTLILAKLFKHLILTYQTLLFLFHLSL